ncbi:Pyruvate-formate lyase-activating enzyme [Dehalogenimonas formicexedens]|uniref:Pyruvate-formate lyase-activating enzyme n=2 Tax=Dehalogenimonas TaxID=670486 RepID=A0A1P8FA23_9CHLR|nr:MULTISPECIES: radical SAM protein [Dehalogenimonas]APV45301.1 Pyruvate-formate lyase-activating enzyme [Dehalogenimonas formicexedens]KTB49106.1 Pyruvate-formate lyase-activating enzyme [Dehalogenimonas alkenigignens]
MNVYHITYEPSFRILDLHFWGCNLHCLGCYKNFEIHDLGLNENAVEQLSHAAPAEPPTHFFTLAEVLHKTQGLDPKYTIFMGQEAIMDPELPALAASLHERDHSQQILLTNGLKVGDLKDIDEVVFSFKTYFKAAHKRYTGQTNETIMTNFKHIFDNGKKLQAEIAYIPGIVEEPDIKQLAKFIAGIDKNILFRVTSYFAVPKAPWHSATREQVENAARMAKLYLNNVTTVTSEEKSGQWKPVVVS